MKILRATEDHLQELVELFNGYRMFYRKPSDPIRASHFLKERLERKDSVIFMALNNENSAVGFTQLYPSFSSVSMQRVYILNDLFVSEQVRGQGAGEALLEHAKDFTRKKEAKGLTLETEITNPAQRLYERLGWKKDTAVFHYTWEV